MGIPREEEFWNNGISACAVCDGASSNYRQQELAVVGGGDTAAEEALYLTKYGKKVGTLPGLLVVMPPIGVALIGVLVG